jgi:hypothetical protein
MEVERLLTAIMRHLTFVDRVNEISLIMLRSALGGETAILADHAENRTRLINTVEKFQNNVEEKINALEPSKINPELVEILQAWVNDVANWVALTDEIDTETSEILENLRQQTTQEIGNLHRSRSQFRGYNLSNVKK